MLALRQAIRVHTVLSANIPYLDNHTLFCLRWQHIIGAQWPKNSKMYPLIRT
jgi:hypothetical protein